MSIKKTIDWDPNTGIYCNLISHEDGSVTIQNGQIIDDILETNKALQNEPTLNSDLGRRVASIPLMVMEQLKQKGIMNDKMQVNDIVAFKRWLNDSENRFFRTNNEVV